MVTSRAGGSQRCRRCFSARRRYMQRRLLDNVVRPLELPDDPVARGAVLAESEWLVTNGLGGYSSGTVAGINTRLELHPAMHFRGYEESVTTHVNRPGDDAYTALEADGYLCVATKGALPPLRMRVAGGNATFHVDSQARSELEFPMERARG